MKDHDSGSVGDARWCQEMDTRVPACNLRKVSKRICGAAEEESRHIDTEDCEKDLGSEHCVLNARCSSGPPRRFYGFKF
jgi:hypothetical protein